MGVPSAWDLDLVECSQLGSCPGAGGMDCTHPDVFLWGTSAQSETFPRQSSGIATGWVWGQPGAGPT